MAYTVAQLHKSDNGNYTYMEPISVTATTCESPNKFEIEGSTNTFQDFALNGNFLAGQVYYLRFLIHRVPKGFYSETINARASFPLADNLDITIMLRSGTDATSTTEANNEILDSFSIESLSANINNTEIGANTTYYARNLIFTPTVNSSYLVFRLSRIAYDVLIESRTWLTDIETDVSRELYDANGKPRNLTVTTTGNRIEYSYENGGDFCTLKNLIPGNEEWLKIGYQCRPGALIVVNKEPIVVGRSGIYEINNGTKITSFMIAAPNGHEDSKVDAFLLDYAYDNENE